MEKFQELAVLREGDVVVVITERRKPTGRRAFSFAIFKEFERGNGPERTSYLGESQLRTAQKLLERVGDRIKFETNKAAAIGRARLRGRRRVGG